MLSDVVVDLVEKTSPTRAAWNAVRMAVCGLMRRLLRSRATAWEDPIRLGRRLPRRARATLADGDGRGADGLRGARAGKLATLWQEMYDEAGIGPSALLVHSARSASS